MNDEIKEILDNFKIYEDRYKKCNETQFIIFYKDIHLLLDYITKLQQEKEDYKSRIEKATKDLFELKDMIYKPESREENIPIQRKISSIIKELNILQNGSDEEW